jgi:hypothetical protein
MDQSLSDVVPVLARQQLTHLRSDAAPGLVNTSQQDWLLKIKQDWLLNPNNSTAGTHASCFCTNMYCLHQSHRSSVKTASLPSELQKRGLSKRQQRERAAAC